MQTVAAVHGHQHTAPALPDHHEKAAALARRMVRAREAVLVLARPMAPASLGKTAKTEAAKISVPAVQIGPLHRAAEEAKIEIDAKAAEIVLLDAVNHEVED